MWIRPRLTHIHLTRSPKYEYKHRIKVWIQYLTLKKRLDPKLTRVR